MTQIIDKWWVMRDLNPRHLRCEQPLPQPTHCFLAKGTLHIKDASAVFPMCSRFARFTEPRTTSYLAQTAAFGGQRYGRPILKNNGQSTRIAANRAGYAPVSAAGRRNEVT